MSAVQRPENWAQWVGKCVSIEASDTSHSVFSGRVFSYSEDWQAFIVQCETRPLHQQATFHVIKLDKIERLTEQPETPAHQDEPLRVRPVDVNKLRQREATAIKKESQRCAKINPSIRRDAQLLFNDIDRTLPCRWDGSSIVVLEDIEIVAPYTHEHVQLRSGAATGGSNRASNSLARVRQIVETYYARLRK